MRVEKQFPIEVHDKTYHLQLLGEFFNAANHQNVTGVSTTAYNLSDNSGLTKACAGQSTVSGQAQDECSTLTYVPLTGAGHAESGFGAVTSTNNVYMYTPREIELTLRLDF
jgi:hypothetical protein